MCPQKLIISTYFYSVGIISTNSLPPFYKPMKTKRNFQKISITLALFYLRKLQTFHLDSERANNALCEKQFIIMTVDSNKQRTLPLS